MMDRDEEVWKPGSFTKNFSLGKAGGLIQLHESIRIGFAGKMEDVGREEFRKRISGLGRPDYIPINFFLFNKRVNGVDHLVADELVFQALTAPPSSRFDKLALFAFNFSYVGKWNGAYPEQRWPALWAFHYIKDRVATEMKWDTSAVSAKDIERFVQADPRYKAKSAAKLSTNLNHLYKMGRLYEFATKRIERWWVDALFLALDRLVEDRKLDGRSASESQYVELLSASKFQTISGLTSVEKELATKHLITLYVACGGRDRFSEEHVNERTALKIKDLGNYAQPNEDGPLGAVHPSNPRILKSIPRACAMLATYSGFDVISALEMAEFDAEVFIKRRMHETLERLREQGVHPTMSAEEVLKLTRGK